MSGRNLLGLAFRLIGLVFTASAIGVGGVTLSFVLRSDQLTGTVIEHSPVQNSISFMPGSDQTGILYYPVVRYTTPDGQERQLTGPRGRSSPRFAVGDPVPVYVLNSEPGNARLGTLMGVWGTAIILAAVALIFFLISLAAPLGFGGVGRGKRG